MNQIQLEISQEPDHCIIKILGEVPLAAAGELERALTRISVQRPKLAILDLSEMPNITSMIMGALVTFYRGVKFGGGRAVIAAATQQVRTALERARLHALFQMSDTVADALAG